MSISQFDNIRVVLAEPNADLRKTLKQTLQEHGFRSILDTGNLSQVVRAVDEGNVDLLIADTSLPEGSFNDYVSELRHGKHGDNPFLVVITLVSEPTRKAVQTAIDSGTDHVLAKPFQPDDMINQVLDLTTQRKRFVVTTDYIGPDRRSTPRPSAMQVPLIDVPNALRQRMTGQVSDGILRRAIEAAKDKINEQKVVRHAFQIGWLLERVLPALESGQRVGQGDGELDDNIQRLVRVARDISRRIRTTRYAHVAEMCMTLADMVDEGITTGFNERDLFLLTKMAELIDGAFDPEREEQGALYTRRYASAPTLAVAANAEEETAVEEDMDFSRMIAAM